MGYHKIFDKYKSILENTDSLQDGLHFHYHPHPMIKHAHLLCHQMAWANRQTFSNIIKKNN